MSPNSDTNQEQIKPSEYGFANNILTTYNKQSKQVKLAIIGMVISLLVPVIQGFFSIATTLIETSVNNKNQTTPIVVYATPQATLPTAVSTVSSTSNLSVNTINQPTPTSFFLQLTYFQTSILLALLSTLVFFFIGTSIFLRKPIKIVGLGSYSILSLFLIAYLYYGTHSILWSIVAIFLTALMYIMIHQDSDSVNTRQASNTIGFFTLYGLSVGFGFMYAGWLQISFMEYVPRILLIGYLVIMGLSVKTW
jgi:uncharacterized protein YneF (UPF0154 family)